MKIDDLRDLVLKRSIDTEDNIKNMKKDKLINLLNNNNIN